MSQQTSVPIYVVTLLLSAFLLFSVQPMFSKMILPLLGGTPSVWNTAMMFFQAMLLAGYGYAHISSRYLAPRAQAFMHMGLLTLCLVFLPVAVPATLPPPDTQGSPILWQLHAMTVALGLPFLVLAGTAPMVQRWFSATDHHDAANPYFLYAASNAGSMAALLAYPTIIEMMIGARAQSYAWAVLYILLIGCIAFCGLMTSSRKDEIHVSPASPITTGQKLLWIALAFIPSSMMLGVTTYITTDIASIPLLWIFPLTLYLGSFIIAFGRNRRMNLASVYLFQSVLMLIMAVLFMKNVFGPELYPLIIHLSLFFVCALSSHIALADKKPDASHLTAFYLYISLGGVLGGIFNTLIAPVIFPVTFEYPLVLAAAMFIPFFAGAYKTDFKSLSKDWLIILFAIAVSVAAIFVSGDILYSIIAQILVISALLLLLNREAYLSLAVCIAAIFLCHPGYDWSELKRTLHIERNFFGTSKITLSPYGALHVFMHGTTIHGQQAVGEEYRLTPLTYFYPEGPAGNVFEILSNTVEGPQNVAVLGLGAGSVACYAHQGRIFDFFEIDPAVISIAQNKSLFTYLSDCGSPYKIIPGDARLELVKMPDQSYDLIFMDAFSSDSIPVHMITEEAFHIYFSKLKPGGLIVINISNRHLNLKPLVAAIAKDTGAEARFYRYGGKMLSPPEIKSASAAYAIVTRNPATVKIIDTQYPHWKAYGGAPTHAWTDDYANFLSLLYRPQND